MRFEQKRVLWELQIDLVAITIDGERTVRFSGYGLPDAVERARAIAEAIGRG